ncbi:hypothetical protein Acor_18730 [Acrocarpospora corrugata]|uniref:Single-stranded DNA-binding protein n=1 Tax=Acrocarpospora corrugata TaxID=35763 RepID=A0A5M3VV65_9ACTN|nr:single-stranded DNA-binding protein [Acrocarpospora corrugata]GER99809.1 hypothetical protein Acor_18730 [Acrocarpospora corrugata]
MSEIYVTLSGNVTDDPKQFHFGDGSRATSMRVAVNRRFLDRQTQTWQDGETSYYTVRCYRALADHVAQSVRRGHPVVVSGKLRVKQFERDGEQRFWVEVEAVSVGHDLKWGITSFERPVRGSSGPVAAARDLRAMEDATRDWELATVGAPGTLRLLEGGAGADDDEHADPFGRPGDGRLGGSHSDVLAGDGRLSGARSDVLAGDGRMGDAFADVLSDDTRVGADYVVDGSGGEGDETPWPGEATPLAA